MEFRSSKLFFRLHDQVPSFPCLFQNIVIGNLVFFLIFGALSIAAGAGDYLNVFNAAVQVPAGAKIYMYGFHSYWYMP